MADLAAIRQSLADALNTLPDVQAHAYKPDMIQPPAAVVEPQDVSFDGAFGRGAELWVLLVKVVLATTSNTAAQQERDKYFGGIRDVYNAVADHMPLQDGTVADDAKVSSARRFDALQIDDQVYFGVEIVVEVIA